jgi:hypothetical protein
VGIVTTITEVGMMNISIAAAKVAALSLLVVVMVGCTTTHHLEVKGTGPFAPLARAIAMPAVNAHGYVCEGAVRERRQVVARAYERNGRETVRVTNSCVVPRY